MSQPTSKRTNAERYHITADPEKESAKRLADSLEPWRYSVPSGPILEIGAGTGIFTDYLIQMFPKRGTIVSDSSENMLNYAKTRIEEKETLTYSQLDAETDNIQQRHYSLICGNHVAHQFNNPASVLEKLALGLTIDGLMLMSFPGEDSFQEWRSTCLDLGIPYTGRSMPETEPLVIHLSVGPVQVDFYEDQSTRYFVDFNEFLSHTQIGGMHMQDDDRQLTDREIKLLNENWKTTRDGSIGLTYHNVFLAVKRIGD